jgi:Outer membrane protein beta-barrel domain
MRPSWPVVLALAVAPATAASAFAARPEPATRASASPAKDDAVRERESESPVPALSILWLEGGAGWERVGLTTLRVRRDSGGEALTGDLVPDSLSGPMVSFGVGVRWMVLTLGVRVGAAFFDDSSPDRSDGTSQLYSIDGELGFRIPAGRVEPYFVMGAGYSRFGGLDDAIQGVGRGLDIDGANLRLAFGLDYFMTRTWSLGARVTGGLLFLSRAGVPLRQLATPEQVSTLGQAKERLLEGEGSSAGTSIAVTFGPAMHF